MGQRNLHSGPRVGSRIDRRGKGGAGCCVRTTACDVAEEPKFDWFGEDRN